jgi:Ca2+-binding RTX toxin-like protein
MRGAPVATITWNSSFGLDLKNVRFSGMLHADPYKQTPSLFAVTYGTGTAYRDEFRGTGFTYDASGTLAGGTVEGFGGIQSGKVSLSVKGISVPATSFVAAGKTSSRSDDLTLLKKALAGNDTITGGNGRFMLNEFVGDKLEGFGGNDVLYGRGGADRLYGGAGADTFVFKSIKETAVASNGRDTIYDFSAKQRDRIDLKAIDANTALGGNQSFTFVGENSFQAKAGELRYDKVSGGAVVTGDVNGDGIADFGIYLKGASTLSKGNFIL